MTARTRTWVSLTAAVFAFFICQGAWCGSEFAVLNQPAMMSAKVRSLPMLAVTRAGARLVAVGERGSILLSDDAGVSWRQAKVPVSVSLTAVQFLNAKTGWAVGHLGVVLHSADGGETWTKQLDGREAAALVLEAAKKRADKGALAEAEHLVADGPDKPFLDLYFENERAGYIVGAYDLIFRTVDAGETWQPWQTHVSNPRGLHFYGIRPAGGALFLVGEQGTLLRSTDQGENFVPLASPYRGSYFGLVTTKSGELVLFGLRGNAFWSGDAGTTWQKIDTGVPITLSAGIELSDGSIVLVSQAGDVLVSADRGRSFRLWEGGERLPAAAIAEAADAHLIVAGLRGVKRLASPVTPVGSAPQNRPASGK
jgi:photosystem II stability/assembly factor-like uncharacterized protein